MWTFSDREVMKHTGSSGGMNRNKSKSGRMEGGCQAENSVSKATGEDEKHQDFPGDFKQLNIVGTLCEEENVRDELERKAETTPWTTLHCK